MAVDSGVHSLCRVRTRDPKSLGEEFNCQGRQGWWREISLHTHGRSSSVQARHVPWRTTRVEVLAALYCCCPRRLTAAATMTSAVI